MLDHVFELMIIFPQIYLEPKSCFRKKIGLSWKKLSILEQSETWEKFLFESIIFASSLLLSLFTSTLIISTQTKKSRPVFKSN